ncbi:MAG TPA: DegT/DnrJ/EryC1/StrS family aminotransferase [Pirellulales bacterium]|nr:DegT/DnrJ/EryC1/StrS family aminotransferase [Pirellulales bacterium]
MNIPLVDLKAQYQSIRVEVNAALQSVLDETCFILGPPVARFETSFAAFCGVEHCVGVASGTDALQLIFRAIDLRPGDEVILPAFTFVATALGVSLAGGQPVLVDVRREDGLIDPEKIEAAITPHTRAILPVHLYGRCAEMDRIHEIAADHHLLVIEDACQAHGATYHGRPAGSLGHAAAFSFYPGKNLGAYGDGGAITTPNAELADRLRLMRNWGSRKKYHHEEVAFNSRLDSVQAAVLEVKLLRLAEWNARRRSHAAAYGQRLARRGDVVLPPEAAAGCSDAWHLYVIRVADRAAKLQAFEAGGIGAGIHYPFPVHRLKAYRHLQPSGRSLREAERWADECLSLPIYPELTDRQIDYVVDHLHTERVLRAA